MKSTSFGQPAQSRTPGIWKLLHSRGESEWVGIAGQHRCLMVARLAIGAILFAVLIIMWTRSADAQTPGLATDPWGSIPTKNASLVNGAPSLLPYLNNGSVFGMPGTDIGDVWHRTQLTGDWGGARTYLARHGFFFDLYSISAYQDVTTGGLKTRGSFIQNIQLSINVDTGPAGLWPAGLFHVTLESRSGSSPQNTFTIGSTVPQYYWLSLPGPFLTDDGLPTEYFLIQSLSPKFSLVLENINILATFHQTLFGDSYKYYFANFNFNKTPQAPNLANPTALGAVALWTPTHSVTLIGDVLDPNAVGLARLG